ncbi:hypothetical protein BK706_17350 [Bacillus thuringiensis serovar leesis]|nr:hypothetical protein BK706_17350 [Bacillus thuringiensis serovar leesis]
MIEVEAPKQCPFCNRDVVFTSNKELYGKEYGNGKCYLCRNCKASVGTHNGTTQPLGVMANKEMKVLKKACHDLFDYVWISRKLSRGRAYSILADQLGILPKDCHFGYFQIDMLIKSITILSDSSWYKKE